MRSGARNNRAGQAPPAPLPLPPVTDAVVAEMRAFAVKPSDPRPYIIIDGRDSYRVLVAYDLVDKALAMSAGA